MIRKVRKNIQRSLRHLKLMRQLTTLAEGNRLCKEAIREQKPFTFAKLGNVESNAVNISQSLKNGMELAEWGKYGRKLYKNAGVFPEDCSTFLEFCSTYTESVQAVDLMGIWYHKTERSVIKKHAPNATLVHMALLGPNNDRQLDRDWSLSLKNKRVLVIHPFTKTIEAQFKKRKLVWPQQPHLLPEFTLIPLKTPLAASIAPSPYSNWQAGLDDLKSKMAGIDFDVALIGAGAWSVPLAVHAKHLGKVGIHTGGATQLFFGIKGNRWEKHEEPDFYNSAWVRPDITETPSSAEKIEKACYW